MEFLMRRFLFGATVALVLFLGAVATTLLNATPPSTTLITLLHTNDTHGHLLPFSYPETFDPDSVLSLLPARRNIGGIARRATIAASVRHEPGRHTLLVDAGDFCDGTPFSTEYKGEADVAAMNTAGYDMACPGNHEFNNTLAQVRKLISMAKFPMLCANVRETGTGTYPFRPYVVRKLGDVRVAFFGLLTTDTAKYPAAREGLEVLPPVEVAGRLVPMLRKEADLVVALSHLGIHADRRLATQVDGIDIIIGGHSHTWLHSPLFVGRPPGPERSSVNGTVIAHAFEWGAVLGRLDLRLVSTQPGRWQLARYWGRPIPVGPNVHNDQTVLRQVEQYWQPIRSKYARRIGEAASDFAQKGPDRAEYNLVADAVREITGQEIALENMGGVRAPLVRGVITYGDLVTLDPFGNTVVTMRLTGRQLKEILVMRRPAVSGLRYVVEPGRLIEATVESKPVEDDASYRVATNSYFARDELFAAATERQDLPMTRLEAIIRYIEKRGTVRPSYDGRRILRNIGDFD